MKAIPLFVCFGFALARTASGQAFGESIQLSQPSVAKTGAATAVPVAPLGPSTAASKPGAVPAVNNSYRGNQSPTFLPSPRDPSGDNGYSFQSQSECGDLLHNRWMDSD